MGEAELMDERERGRKGDGETKRLRDEETKGRRDRLIW
jgi:hypothetical protein